MNNFNFSIDEIFYLETIPYDALIFNDQHNQTVDDDVLSYSDVVDIQDIIDTLDKDDYIDSVVQPLQQIENSDINLNTSDINNINQIINEWDNDFYTRQNTNTLHVWPS